MKRTIAAVLLGAAFIQPAFADDASKDLIIGAQRQAASETKTEKSDTGTQKTAHTPRATSGDSSKAFIIARAHDAAPKTTGSTEAVARTEKTAEVKKDTAGKTAKPASDLHALVAKAAAKHGVPVELASAVVMVESRFNPRATGSAGEIGLMQIKPATARGLGYTGSIQALYDPETNLEWGMRYLARAYELGGGTTCGTLLRYNAGHYATRMTSGAAAYCGRVKTALASADPTV
ncbi:soluble lytic murein transglycosylase-like protein [Rhodopseudomonas julia]|uniref:Soluble lytic murein transglycosylase-like protein n=1 Tax=Rhodopseudomonas julia TaxID=200617 RepID=A0ABU0CC50_9BRAD|nr:transglycosylase SLT domain-containing protein [Rhodopseudomonas julia]MDQ0326647.1 soluble lytic murein transglycosylase-like protein [Rhodopseudomonas julia]